DGIEPMRDFKAWFKSMTRVRRSFGKMVSRDDTNQLPEEAAQLQDQIIEIGIKRMIQEESTDQIAHYFQDIKSLGDLPASMLGKIQDYLCNIGLEETAKSLWSPNFDESMLQTIQAGAERAKRAHFGMLDLIAKACGRGNPTSATQPYRELSILLSALHFWESTPRQNVNFEDADHEADVIAEEIIRALSHSLQLNKSKLAAEAMAAASDPFSGIFNKIEKVEATPDWSLISTEEFKLELVSKGILHPNVLISFCAATIISNGIGVDEGKKVVPIALESGSAHAIRHAALIAEDCFGGEAAELLLARLSKPISRAHSCIFGVLAKISKDQHRDETVKQFFDWMNVDAPDLVTSIAEQLSDFEPPLGKEHADLLRGSLESWMAKGRICKEHGEIAKGGSCPKCYTVPPSPCLALLKELDGVEPMPLARLVDLSHNAYHDISDWAKMVIIDRAKVSETVFGSLLDEIANKRLAPRILDKLLKLPIEKESSIAKTAKRMLQSNDRKMRLAVVGQLTGEWIDRSEAIALSRQHLGDERPEIRTLALRVLRLLEAE
ncbi:MAG: FeoC-like transcriptional regulator, partial [bacterium]|nr:FeoC-like transcriptional regulator [bacterium]